MNFQELVKRLVRIEADHLRIRTDVRSPEDSGRPLRDVVHLEALEQRDLDLGTLGNRNETDLSFFAALAQPGAEAVSHAAYLCGSGAASHTAHDDVEFVCRASHEDQGRTQPVTQGG